MARKEVTSVLLIIMTGALWLVKEAYLYRVLEKLFRTSLTITAIYIIFSLLFSNYVAKRIKDSKTRYSFRKAVFIIEITVFVLATVWIWIDTTQNILVAYGLGAAGVAVALQDVLKNFAGSLLIFSNSLYSVGDRVQMGETTGDVIDVGLLYTTLLETRGWVKGDQATGRLTQVPNGFVLGNDVSNYTKDHSLIWDEITLPITYDSDWKKAAEDFTDIVNEETKDLLDKSEKEISKLRQKYYLEERSSEPHIFIYPTDNWIQFGIRYVAEVRQRRVLRDRISRALLEYVEDSKDVKLASETFDVTVHKP